MSNQAGRSQPISSAKEGETGPSTAIVVKEEQLSSKPSLYRVLLLNDDYTPMEFVVEVLKKYFHKDHTTATQIMLQVHHDGRGECGVYPYDIAETKAALVMSEAQKREYPLQCVIEKE